MSAYPLGPQPRTPARILIVDDEPAMLRTVERILEVEHRVRGSAVPAEALELAKSFRPHLAILDIRMADMDGFELMNALKQLDPQMRVILMTGSAYGTDDKLIRAIREVGSKSGAAERLGIPRQSLQKMVKRLEITDDELAAGNTSEPDGG